MSRRIPDQVEAERRRRHAAGETDADIARSEGVDRSTIRLWRARVGLPARPRGLDRDAAARRMLLYALRWSDHAIAREERVHPVTVRDWRVLKGLPANFALGVNQRHRPRQTLADVFARVRRSMPRWLPRDVADDAIGDLVRDVLDGTIPLDRIETEARRYGNRVLERFASRYGPRSLDEELGDGDGFRMVDMVRDDRSSSWLEEMGATAW